MGIIFNCKHEKYNSKISIGLDNNIPIYDVALKLSLVKIRDLEDTL